MHGNSTVLEDFTVFPARDISFPILLFLAKNISRKFLGFGTVSLLLSQFIAILASISNLFEAISKSLPHLYKVVSSAKLQTSVSFIKRSKSFMKMLDKIGPKEVPRIT